MLKAKQQTIPMASLLSLYSKYKTPILYSGGSVSKAFAQMVVGFIVAKFVTPRDFGLWSTLNLALTYSLFMQSGLINGLNRELPYLFGKGEEKEAMRMAGTVQTYTLFLVILTILVSIPFFLFVYIRKPSNDLWCNCCCNSYYFKLLSKLFVFNLSFQRFFFKFVKNTIHACVCKSNYNSMCNILFLLWISLKVVTSIFCVCFINASLSPN